MSNLKLNVQSGRPNSQLQSAFETAGGNHSIANRIINFITSLCSGTELAAGVGLPPSIAITVQGNEAQASGTLTFSSVVATNTLAINGVTFTCEASGASGNQFNVGVDDTHTATNAAAAINASVTSLVQGYVTAVAVGAVVTVTSVFHGLSGNQATLVGSANIAANHARLVGGAVDANALTISF